MGCGVSPRCCRGPSPKLDCSAGSHHAKQDAVTGSKILGPNSNDEDKEHNSVNACLGDCKDVCAIGPVAHGHAGASDDCDEFGHQAGVSSPDAASSSAAGESPLTSSGNDLGTASSDATTGLAPDEVVLNYYEDQSAQEPHEKHRIASGDGPEHADAAGAQKASRPGCSGSGEAAASSENTAMPARSEATGFVSSCVSGSYNDAAASSSGPAAAAAALEAVALDSNGAVIIQRQVYAEPQQAYTVIWNEDGSHCAFGQQTISSLLINDAATTHAWLGLLTHRQLHGLVHESGRRLAEQSQDYQSRRHSSEQAEVLDNYAFFGLAPEAASDKDLEAAYRRLAKQLHPDKNGGTEEAKERFQEMHARYEMLLAHRGQGRAMGSIPSDGDLVGGQAPGPEGPIMYDPRDPGSLLAALWEILPKLKFLAQDLR